MRLTLILIILAFHEAANSQIQIPELLSFSYMKSKTTMGNSTKEFPLETGCISVQRVGTKVFFRKCNSITEIDKTFQITQLTKENNASDIYSITYFGTEFQNAGPGPAFLTYSYDYQTQQWVVSLESILDQELVPLWRLLCIYYNR